MLQWFHDLITYGHDLQVRFKWNNPNDIGKFTYITIPIYEQSPNPLQLFGIIEAFSTLLLVTTKDLGLVVGTGLLV